MLRQIITIIAISLLTACAHHPRVEVSIAEAKKTPTFEFATKDVNGMLGLQIWNPTTLDLLWQVKLHYFNGNQIVYGDVPTGFITFNGRKGNASQTHPRDDRKPESLPPNESLHMLIDLQYDAFLSACSTTRSFEIHTDSYGNIDLIRPFKITHIPDFSKQMNPTSQ